MQELQEDLGQLGYGRQDFDWAVAVVHSRCFVYGRSSRHMVVPGVDMANHSFTPNAVVRCATTLTLGSWPGVGPAGAERDEEDCRLGNGGRM